MKTRKSRILVLSIVVALGSASALTHAAGTDVRQGNQRARIVDGVASGELTARETVRLTTQQRHIARTENRFKADGAYTARERAIVHHKQNKASRNIARQKHDGQIR